METTECTHDWRVVTGVTCIPWIKAINGGDISLEEVKITLVNTIVCSKCYQIKNID